MGSGLSTPVAFQAEAIAKLALTRSDINLAVPFLTALEHLGAESVSVTRLLSRAAGLAGFANKKAELNRRADSLTQQRMSAFINDGGVRMSWASLENSFKRRYLRPPHNPIYLVALLRALMAGGVSDPDALPKMAKKCLATLGLRIPTIPRAHQSALTRPVSSACELPKEHYYEPGNEPISIGSSTDHLSICQAFRLRDLSGLSSPAEREIGNAMGACLALKYYPGLVGNTLAEREAVITIGGIRIIFEAFDQVTKGDFEHFFFNEPSKYSWFANITPSDVFLDIGANIGIYSILPAALVGCHVFSIEPLTINISTLRRNVERNGLADLVRPLHLALGSKRDTCRLYFEKERPGVANARLASENETTDTHCEDVNQFTLDDLVTTGTVAFPTHMKVDVDGQEASVVEGMHETLSDRRLRSIRIEIWPRSPHRGPLIDKILSYGFKVVVADDLKNLTFNR
jgi:FkbM family methyltransferase